MTQGPSGEIEQAYLTAADVCERYVLGPVHHSPRLIDVSCTQAPRSLFTAPVASDLAALR